ncbi:MAG TPA: trigger factor [Dissulfurispiraceae bacterium]|nr:trigger factor [Dissulfurispiraceae bacterium]
MLKSCEEVSSTKKRLTIEIPADALESEIRKGLQEAQRRANLPGFRSGKAPMSIVEKRYGKGVESEVLEKLVPEYYMNAVKEAEIKPVAKPEMEEGIDFKRNAPVVMTFTVEVRPSIDGLSYENIAVKDIPIEIKEEEIDTILKSVSEEKGTFEAIDDAATRGDLVTLDYTTENGDESKDTVIKVGSGPYPPEFFDAIEGKRKDEEFSAVVSFPNDSSTQFAGKTLKFVMMIKDIKRKNIPTIDDELAKDMGMENLQSLRDRIREDLHESKTTEADRKKQIEIIEKLLSSYQFDAPEGMVKFELERMLGEVRAAGKQGGTNEELEAEYQPKAVKSARISILLDIIGEREGISVSEDELKEEIMNFSKRYYVTPENVVKYYIARDGSLDGIKNAIYEKKAMKALLAKAKIEKE